MNLKKSLNIILIKASPQKYSSNHHFYENNTPEKIVHILYSIFPDFHDQIIKCPAFNFRNGYQVMMCLFDDSVYLIFRFHIDRPNPIQRIFKALNLGLVGFLIPCPSSQQLHLFPQHKKQKEKRKYLSSRHQLYLY